MKTGTAVKFIGAANKSPLEKTYIWDVATIKGNGTTIKDTYMYLIQHPEGTLLTPESVKDFAGFKVDKLTMGKSYMAAEPHELIDLANPSSSAALANQETSDIGHPTSDLITTTLPRQYFEEIKDYFVAQKEQLETNKMVRMTMKKEDLNDAINYFTQMITATENALKQTQPSVSETLAKDTNATQNIEVLETKQPTTNNQQPTANV
jgi:hypothetical protein